MSVKNNFIFLYNINILLNIFILFSILIKFSLCEACPENTSIKDKTCFNDVLLFNSKKYRAGHFVTYKNKDMIVEFSDDGAHPTDGFSRIFYGLKANGRYYFSDESPTWEIENIGNIGDTRGRYESLNILVVTEDDLTRENEYLFSTSSYNSLTELHNIKNKDYIYTKTTSFFGKTIYSFKYDIVEVIYESKIFYFIAFTYSSSANGDCICIKKFGFKSFSLTDINNYNNTGTTIADNNSNRIVNLFVLDNLEILVLVYDKSGNFLTLKFYDYNLNIQGNEISLGYITSKDTDGIFFKSVELPDNKRIFMFYLNNNADPLYLNIYQFTKNSNNLISKTDILTTSTKDYWFTSYVTFNDIYKLTDTRIAIVTTSTNKATLVLLMYDFYNEYKNMKRRWYLFNLDDFGLNKELSLHSFNDYLMLTMTGDSYYADLIIFGFANGTDSIIDISPYLMDTSNYNTNLNLIQEMYSNITIDNNIFGYIKVDQIKIVSIPEHIKFYNGTEDNQIEISSEDIIDIDINYSLYQNKDLLKTEEYYDLYYQGIIKELDYDDFYIQQHRMQKYPENNGYNNYQNDFKANIFYGRTNKFSFKLCYDYCSTCYELGDLINRQKCISCKTQYSFDYWNYYNSTYPTNCVPENYMNDIENSKIIPCDSEHPYKYYFNETKNATICFKSEYGCPKEYPYLNETTNECIKYFFPTTIPEVISNTIQIIPSTIITIIQSSILTDKCIYGKVVNKQCEFNNMTNSEIIIKLKNEVLETYPPNGINIVIPTQSNYLFQLTSTNNELKSINGSLINNNSMSIINLNKCESKLKKDNNIPKEYPLIILKYEKITNIASEKIIQYEIYNPINFVKLNLDICSDNNIDIDIVIPLELNEEIKKLYNLLKEQGYDLFDENNKFYTDICSPFTAENGADVLLDDRLLYFYNKIINIIACPQNCKYSKFLIYSESLYCKCKASNDNINVEKNNIIPKSIDHTSLLNYMKYSSYKTMKCYKLVFNVKHFIKNAGSIIILIFIINYVFFFIYYIIKGINPLKLIVSKKIFDEKEDIEIFPKKNNLGLLLDFDNKIKLNKKKIKSKNNKNSSDKVFAKNDIKDSWKELLFPPRKSRANKIRMDNKIKKKESEKFKLIDIINKNKSKEHGKINRINNRRRETLPRTKKPKKSEIYVENEKSDKVGKRKYIIELKKDKEIRINKEKQKEQKKNYIELKNNKIPGNKKKESKEKENEKDIYNIDKEIHRGIKNKIKKKEIKDEKDFKILDDYQLNHLVYEEALEKDKRGLCKIYCSMIKRDEIILFTFASWNDYNLFYIKIERFIFIILNLMAMNAFFFADESIHTYFLKGVKYYFVQQILQIVLAIIITHIIEIILCFLSLTDRYIYQIKALKKPETAGNKIIDILKKMNINLIIFFDSLFFISLFYWYFISVFCAVYKNTQGMFLIDCVISFIFYAIDPFIVYAFVTLVRIIAIKIKVKWIYKLSSFFPIF